MKCSACKQIDSLAHKLYMDKNNNLMDDSELTAFQILHPEDKSNTFKKVILCGICYEKIKQSNSKVKLVKKRSTFTQLSKAKANNNPKNYYVCAFCHTPNEPLRNTCKNCERILFSTEYDTKRISKYQLSDKKTSRQIIDFLVVTSVIAITGFLVYKGVEGHVSKYTTNAPLEEVVSDHSILAWRDGSTYNGDVKEGLPHGKGTMRWTNGTTYVGDFFEGDISGSGEYIWQNGQKYIGELKAGKPEGQGTMYYQDGSTHTGMWVGGEPK
ncbi:hypothetical protein FS935_21275 [Metabacillus litoralis]|uniref:MORN repeat protein n=1 Tax=Metabacillus litoralis TaxID=152268 RepID=A0A5C6VAI7_9BACI|nr:hypothetical protein [Metabacillus litoralis]TXC82229.1 hypothetical protein FS935_21275 [Metabacillus litoralis]